MSATTHPAEETFEQFYARIFANRKANILACTDPVKRAELEAADQRFEAQWKAAWQINEAKKDGFQSAVDDEELRERSGSRRMQRRDCIGKPSEHATYRVIDGKAW